MQRDLAENQLSRAELLDLKNKRTGMAIFQISWIMIFVCLIVVNLQIRSNYPTWPPEGVPKLGLGLPTVATIALLASAFLVSRSVNAVEANLAFGGMWRAAIILGVVFVLIMAWEWINAPMGNSTGQYGTVFRVMTGYHALHALAAGAFMWSVYRNRDTYTSAHYWAVEGTAKLWYFVVVAWIMFYVVLYWI
jgi:cytochrome c oxidase subunit III